ncbi:chorismate mutase [candidate division KSB1 bacterium]|nr:chorismate mutase [candidate division KSB1 bacterium]
MSSLIELRQEIDQLDQQLLSLLNQRAALALKIGAEKIQQNLPILAPAREQFIYARLTQLNPGPLSNPAIQKIFEAIIIACRDLQLNQQDRGIK